MGPGSGMLTVLRGPSQDTREGRGPHRFQLCFVMLPFLQNPYPLRLLLLDRMNTLQVHLDIMKLFAGNDVARIHARERNRRSGDAGGGIRWKGQPDRRGMSFGKESPLKKAAASHGCLLAGDGSCSATLSPNSFSDLDLRCVKSRGPPSPASPKDHSVFFGCPLSSY